MSPSLRKKLLIGGGSVVGVIVVALLVGPSFVDLNKYKAVAASEAKAATGRDLVIEGPISLSLLPLPSVSVSGVKFANMPGAKNPAMVEIKSITVKPALLPLLGGNIAISEVTLVQPKIALEVDAQGRASWDFAPPGAPTAKPAAPAAASAPPPISVGNIRIEDGTFTYNDAKAGMAVAAQKMNLSASLGSLAGPYALAGGATVNGAPLKIDLSVGAKAANGHATNVTLETTGGKFGFKGALSELGPNARVGGTANIAADSLAAFAASLSAAAGQPAPALPPMLAGRFSFDGGIEASQTAFAAKDFKMNLGGDSASGSLAVTLKPAMAIDGKIVVPKLDLDRTLAAMAQPSAPAAATTTSKPPATAPAAGAPAASTASALPNAKLVLEVGEVIYNKTPIRNVAVEIDARGGAVAVPRLTATLPGDMVLQAKSTISGDPARPTVAGDFSLIGPKLRDTLKWLAIDVSSMPANKLNAMSLKGRLASAGGNVQVRDAVFEIDDIKGKAGVVVTLGVPLSVVTTIDFDTLDVDPFLAAKPAAVPAVKPAAAPSAPASATPPAAHATGPSIGLKTKIARLIYNKETIGGIEVDVTLQGNVLKLNDIKVANLGGARLAVRGSVVNYASPSSRPDIAFNFDAPDMAKVMKIAGAAAPAGLTTMTASGGVAGSIEAMNLRDFSVAAMGYTVKATGALGLPGATKGAPSAVTYKGSVTVNGQTIEGSVDAKLAGAKPNVTIDLKSAMLDLNKLSGAGSAPPARGRPAQPAAASAPIDTSPLRSVDASVKLVAATLVSSALRITNADLAMTLKDGVLTLGHFKGALYGGSMQLSGVVDGSKPALAFDMKGDVDSVILGEMLRQTSGSNQFGSVVKVTIDGKLSAKGIALKGGGTTTEQVKSSMTGGANLSGHVFVGADKALTALGSAATGAAGAAIDSTLGSALGAVGQRGGVSAGNILNAISLVLNRFVNHDNPITGRVDIAGGVLSDKGLVVQGNKAAANITTRTNLVASTTDTTINFMIAEDSSAPYLITTVRGPTSSPSYNVARGTAKDPPGATNTLTGGGTGTGTGAAPQQQPSNSPVPGVQLPRIFGR